MGIRKKLADALELPYDIMLDLPVLHLTGSSRLLVENHKGLAEFDGVHIRIRAAKGGAVLVEGEKLKVSAVGRDDILVTGKIKSVSLAGLGG
jgi:sporulation protein YqfC